jgi:hypothetical protein
VNKSAESVGTDHPQQPQNKQKGSNREEHLSILPEAIRYSHEAIKQVRMFHQVKQVIPRETHSTMLWLEHLNDPVTDSIAGQIGHRMQT